MCDTFYIIFGEIVFSDSTALLELVGVDSLNSGLCRPVAYCVSLDVWSLSMQVQRVRMSQSSRHNDMLSSQQHDKMDKVGQR